MTLLTSVLEQGLIYAVMALGVYITYKILDFPDLTVDGSFPLGAAITAAAIAKGAPAPLMLPVSFLAGAAAGVCTGLIHVKVKVRDLLSGIIVMTALYSVNLRIAGRANLPIYQQDTIFENPVTASIFRGAAAPFATAVVLIVTVLLVKGLLDAYLHTQSGFLLRAVGDNDTIVTSLGVDKGRVKIIGLAIANGLAALSGCLFAQQQRFFDISIGTGTVVIGLASVIIGTSLVRKLRFLSVTACVVFGALAYKGCVALAISLGLKSTDLNLVTALLFLLILMVGMDRRKKGKQHA